MYNLMDISFSGYKSFENEAKIENIKNVNLIIGKNNSGKSTVLQVVYYVLNKKKEADPFPKEITVKQKITREAVSKCFAPNEYYRNSQNLFEYGSSFVDDEIKYTLSTQQHGDSLAPSRLLSPCEIENAHARQLFLNVANDLYYSLPSNVRIIDAERDIQPEYSAGVVVSSNGDGATSIIENYLNNSKKDESVVEKQLLEAFNAILGEDAHFDNIKVQQIENRTGEDKWEIFLTENGNRYPLSDMGSGLKTILLVLIDLIVCQKESYSTTFLFEELENNLHPALQRRLFEFIYDFAIKNDLTVFLSSHSHVAINCFFNKEFANIYHVEKQRGISTIKKIENYLDKIEILDDLDVRASDLLQSNGIIWVEGPSDRVYIKRWLDLVDASIKENEHYQFVYYGGKLLSHYSTNDEKDLINILLTNRNSAIVIDSDKKSRTGSISDTKTRIKTEFENNGLMCWITKGKEIENYLTSSSVNKLFSANLPQIGQYELFPTYIKSQDDNFANHKVAFANNIAEFIEKSDLAVLDLKQQIENLIKQIKKWNRLQ